MNKTIQVPLSEEDINTLKAGDYVYLSGIIYTARDAAHKRMYETLLDGKELPVDVKRAVYLLSRANTSKRKTGHWISRTDNKQ